MIRKPERESSHSGFLLVGVGCIETLFKPVDLVFSHQLHKPACFAPLHRPLLRKTVSFVGAQRGDIASHHFRQITCVMAPASPEKLTERAYHRADSMQHINKV